MLKLGIVHKCPLFSLTRICLNSQFSILNSLLHFPGVVPKVLRKVRMK